MSARDRNSITIIVDFIDDYSVVSGDDGHIPVILNIIDIFQRRNTKFRADEIQVNNFSNLIK